MNLESTETHHQVSRPTGLPSGDAWRIDALVQVDDSFICSAYRLKSDVFAKNRGPLSSTITVSGRIF